MDPHPINEGPRERWRSDPIVVDQHQQEIARDFAQRHPSRRESLLVWGGLAVVVLAVAGWALLTR